MDADVFKTSSVRIKKVKTSSDQTKRRLDVWQKMSDLQRLKDVGFRSSRRWPIFDVLVTSLKRRLSSDVYTFLKEMIFSELLLSEIFIKFWVFLSRLIFRYEILYHKSLRFFNNNCYKILQNQKRRNSHVYLTFREKPRYLNLGFLILQIYSKKQKQSSSDGAL